MDILFRTLTHKSRTVSIDGPTPVDTILQKLEGMFPPIEDTFDGVEQSLVYAGKVYHIMDIFDPSKVNSHKFVLYFQMGADNDYDDSEDSVQSVERDVIDANEMEIIDLENNSNIYGMIYNESHSNGHQTSGLTDESLDESEKDNDEEDEEGAFEDTEDWDDPHDYLESDTLRISEPEPASTEGTETTDELYETEEQTTIRYLTRATIGLGFTKEEVEKALKSSNNDSEYAISLLIANCQGDSQEDIAAIIPNLPIHENKTDCLVTSPYFQDLADIIQRNPRRLRSYIKSVSKESPEMIIFFKQYEDIFLNLLNKPTRIRDCCDFFSTGESEDTGHRVMGTDANSVRLRQEALRAFAINNGLLMGPPHNATLNAHAMDQLISLSLSSRDLASIKLIQDMGFDRERVIGSYIAHDRSENDTIDALLKNDEDV